MRAPAHVRRDVPRPRPRAVCNSSRPSAPPSPRPSAPSPRPSAGAPARPTRAACAGDATDARAPRCSRSTAPRSAPCGIARRASSRACATRRARASATRRGAPTTPDDGDEHACDADFSGGRGCAAQHRAVRPRRLPLVLLPGLRLRAPVRRDVRAARARAVVRRQLARADARAGRRGGGGAPSRVVGDASLTASSGRSRRPALALAGVALVALAATCVYARTRRGRCATCRRGRSSGS